MNQTVRRAAVTVALIAGASGLALAHHSYAAFDMTAQKVITGTVVKVNWTNPHTWVWLDVPNEQGAMDTWGVEGMSPNYLARRGWSRTTIKPGDKLTITVHPAKDGSKGGSWISAKRPDGEVLMMTGDITNP
ncbi:MAG: hypothetical protein C5B51_18665 [Terriglobia bacterium]|nr:MAG: hypothetical protein C5B51_18665 [Terriglobia bacterium]